MYYIVQKWMQNLWSWKTSALCPLDRLLNFTRNYSNIKNISRNNMIDKKNSKLGPSQVH